MTILNGFWKESERLEWEKRALVHVVAWQLCFHVLCKMFVGIWGSSLHVCGILCQFYIIYAAFWEGFQRRLVGRRGICIRGEGVLGVGL